MTIEYKDSKRIVALSSDVLNTPTYSDDFTGTDDWADQGSGVGVNTTTDRLEFSSWTDDGTNNSSTLDLGSALSDTKWIIRFRLHFSAYSNTSDTTGPTFGMWANPSSTGGSSAEDSLFLWTLANAGTKITYISSNDNQAIGGTDTNLSYAWVTGTTYYVQLQRDGSSFSATIWTGSYEGTEVASGTNSINGTNTGLRYFGVKSFMVNRGGSWTGWLDDLKIYDGILPTSLTNKPTNVQDNSLLIEKDTANRYWFSEALAPTFENDFGTTNDWTKVGTTITVNDHVSGKCSINDPAISSSDRVHKSLGVTLSDTAWVATCEINISAMSGSQRAFPVQFSSTTGSYRSSHDSIAIRLGGDLSGSSPSIGMSRNDGGTVTHLTDANSIQVSTGTTLYYVKIWRDGSDLKLAVYTNDDYATGQVGSTQTHQSLGSPTGLSNVVIGSDDASEGGVNATVDNLKVYNNVITVTPATWINEFGISDGLMFGGVSTSSYADFSDSQSWNGTSWTTGGSLTGARQSGASAGTGSTSARYVNGYNSTPAPYPNSNRNESYNGTAWSSDTVVPNAKNGISKGGCGTSNSMIVTGGHANGTGDLNQFYKWTGSWSTIANGITGSQCTVTGSLSSALITKQTSAQTWNGSSWTSSTATNVSRKTAGGSGISSESGFRCFDWANTNPFVNSSESWNGTAWTARGNAPYARAESASLDNTTDSLMSVGGSQSYGGTNHSTTVQEYRKGVWSAGSSITGSRRASGGAGS